MDPDSIAKPVAAAERAYHKGHVAEDLRRAAETILAKEQVEDVTVRRLAREVGVTPANFYNHFASVDALLFDIAADAFDDMSRSTARVWRKGGAKADLLVAAAIDFVRYGVRHKEKFRLMFGRKDGERHARFRAAANASFAQLVRFIYDDDRFNPEDPAAAHESCSIAYGFFALCYGLARTISSGMFELDREKGADLERFVERTVRPFLDGSAIEALARPR